MDESHWDSLASRFDREIFNPLAGDFRGTFVRTLKRHGRRRGTAADLGCGNGRQLALIARYFRNVLAVDHSGKCVARARRACRQLRNVSFRKQDLAGSLRGMPKVDAGVCINVAIMPSFTVRMRLLENVTGLIRRGGRLFLVVPSVESVLLSAHRLVRWNLEAEGDYRAAAAAAGDELGFTARSIRDGIVDAGGVPTKHYLREELELLMKELGHRVVEIRKMEYRWSSEFARPPKSMQAPYPWDWLVVSGPAGTRR